MSVNVDVCARAGWFLGARGSPAAGRRPSESPGGRRLCLALGRPLAIKPSRPISPLTPGAARCDSG